MALSDSSSTQDFFNEPASSLESSRKLCVEKKLSVPNSQVGPPGKDLQGATEEKGMKTWLSALELLWGDSL